MAKNCKEKSYFRLSKIEQFAGSLVMINDSFSGTISTALNGLGQPCSASCYKGNNEILALNEMGKNLNGDKLKINRTF